MTTFLLQFSQRSPLENVADAFLKYKAWPAAKETFDAYEEFLSILDDPARRKHLEELKIEEAMTDGTFRQARASASAFQEGLNKLFFKTDDHLISATQIYGVF